MTDDTPTGGQDTGANGPGDGAGDAEREDGENRRGADKGVSRPGPTDDAVGSGEDDRGAGSDGITGDDLPPEVDRAREDITEALERSAEVYGLNRSYGRLYGVLFFADGPVSLDELVDESGYAKSTVSTAMQALERLHLVHRRSIPGEGKKAFYEAERDFWRVLQEFMRREVQREIDIMTRAIDDAAERLESVDDERARRDLRKVESLERMYGHSQRLVDLLTSASIDRLSGLLDRLRRD